MRKIIVLLFALASLPVFAQHKVMSRNLYLGADLTRAIAAPDFNSFQTAVNTIWSTVQATNFPERAAALAEEIRRERPLLIGLQEAVIWRTGAVLSTDAATEVRYDFLQLLRERLESLGLQYTVVAEVANLDLEVPLVLAGFDLRLTDRGVILARTDLDESTFKVSNAQSGNFQATLTVNVLGMGVPVKRGWMRADIDFRGSRFRFVNTHLESFANPIRDLQAAELLAGPLDTTLPVLLVGDLNSLVTEEGTYGRVVAGGFSDPWRIEKPADPGFTCCQEENLRNSASLLNQRIDFILLRNTTDARLRVGSVTLLGVTPADKTASGLWPSDHAGVVAEVRVEGGGGRRRRAVGR